MTDGVHVRLMVTRGVKRTPYQDPRVTFGPATVVIIAEHKEPLPATVTDGITLFTTHVRRAAPDTLDPKLNSHSKLNDITACIQAYTAGADEALMLDPHGFVATCNSTHFFIVGGTEDAAEVLTSDGRYCLAGITRANVLEICAANGIPARETTFSLTDVYARTRGVRDRHIRGRGARAVGRRPHDRRWPPRADRRAAAGAVPRARRRRRCGAQRAMSDVVRVAMWSGPRNISTAMMRAFENRPDTVVVDEPLYAAYLARTGIDHPAREEVIASQPTDLDDRDRRAFEAAARRAQRPLRQAHGPPRLARDGPALDARLPQRAADPRPGRGGRLVRARARELRARGHRAAPAGMADGAVGRARRRGAGHRRGRLPASRPRRTCAGCATGWASPSPTGCCPGRRARATPTAYGRRTGTRPSGRSTGFEPWRPREIEPLRPRRRSRRGVPPDLRGAARPPRAGVSRFGARAGARVRSRRR